MSYKFEIGDTLCHVANQSHRLFVISRMEEECPGGKQYHYSCRLVAPDGISQSTLKVNECELCEIPKQRTIDDMIQQLKVMAVEEGDLKLAADIREYQDELKSGK